MRDSIFWPGHWLRLLTGANDFTTNPVLRHAGLHARGLYGWRVRLANAACERRRRRLRAGLPPEQVEQLARDGFVRLDDFLPLAQFEAMRSEIAAAALPMIEMAQPPALTRRINLDAHSCRGRYPALHALLTNGHLLGLVRYAAGYAGQPLIAVQCIHGDAPGASHDPQTDWHVDTFHSCAKAWLFLHDVRAQDGPLAYWPGTHSGPVRAQWLQEQAASAAAHPNRLHARGSFRAPEAEIREMHGAQAFVADVRANTLVVADTSGLHRRTPSPHPTVRVEVYLSLRRNPFFAGLYPSVLGLPVLRERWAGWVQAWYHFLWRRNRPKWIPAAQPGLQDAEVRALQGAESTGLR